MHAHACTHSTYTPTLVSGGLKNNIVPDDIAVELDVRVLPGETTADVERFTAPAARRPARHHRRRAPHRAEPLPHVGADLAGAASAPCSGPTPTAASPRRCSPAPPTAATCGPLGVPVFGFGVLSAALDPATYWSRFHGDDERIDIESLALSTAAWEHVARDVCG